MNSTSYPEKYKHYVEMVPEMNVFELLEQQTKDLLKSLIMTSNAKAETAYAPGKWNIKQILQHLMDIERVWSFRALAIARADRQHFPAFDADEYAKMLNPNERELRSIMEEMKNLRTTTIDLFKSFDKTALNRCGSVAAEELSVKQIIIILLGHEMHHHKFLKEKYL